MVEIGIRHTSACIDRQGPRDWPTVANDCGEVPSAWLPLSQQSRWLEQLHRTILNGRDTAVNKASENCRPRSVKQDGAWPLAGFGALIQVGVMAARERSVYASLEDCGQPGEAPKAPPRQLHD